MIGPLLLRILVFAGSVVGGALLVLAAAAFIGPAEGGAGQTADGRGEPAASLVPGASAQPFTEVELSTDPIPLATLEPDALLAVAEATEEDDSIAVADPTGFPRLLPISQFDGGPLERANCTMAAGAMLARVAYGITTTGSMLRSLQDDGEGGTSFRDLQTALDRGYGVRPAVGLVTPRQLRSLLSAGFAVAVIGVYGELDPPFSLQPSFTGGHAVYVDGYYPGDAVIGEAFYVIDPLHRPHSGYRGAWWPAEVLEDFGLAWPAGGRFYAAWAFPTGTAAPRVPRPPDLPPVPEEDDVPPPPAPGAEGEPGDREPDEPALAADAGGVEGPTLGEPPRLGGIRLEPAVGLCLGPSPPAFCPTGIPGTIRLASPLPAISGPPEIEVLSVGSDRPNLVRVGFRVDPGDSTVDVHYWLAVGPRETQVAASITPRGGVGGPELVATLPVLADATYRFRVYAEREGAVTWSEIGTFTAGGGLTSFGIHVREAVDPAFEVSDMFPYSRQPDDSLVPPLIPCESASEVGDRVRCVVSESVTSSIGADQPILCRGGLDAAGTAYCLDPLGIADVALADGCLVAEISYAFEGLDPDGVVARAIPEETYLDADGAISLRPVVEATSSSSEDTIELGCLTPGATYQVTIDAIGDTSGTLATRALQLSD